MRGGRRRLAGLDLAKVEAGKLDLTPAPVDLGDFLQGVCNIVRVKADEKDLLFVHLLPPTLPQAACFDDKRLRQVLINLLGNAIKFTDRGQVSLHVTWVSGSDTQARLRFEVRDTGPGMTPEQLEVIFQPFEQVGDARRRVSGTGLGLPISRQLVRLMGSEIHVDSQPGEGSCFWFEVDVTIDARSAAPASNQDVVVGYEGPRKTLLVVDDIEGNRAVLVDWLGLLDFDVHEADNGVGLLVKAQALHPDLIITDLAMPQLDGLEATRRLRRMPECAGVPVIAVSAHPTGSDPQQSLDAGANVFLPKPVELDRLLHQVGVLLRLTWVVEQPRTAKREAAPFLR